MNGLQYDRFFDRTRLEVKQSRDDMIAFAVDIVVVERLIDSAKAYEGPSRSRILEKIFALLDHDEYKVLFGEIQYRSFIPWLIHTVQHDPYQSSKLYAIKCLWYLSRCYTNREILNNPNYSLIKILMNILHLANPIQSQLDNYAFLCLINLSLHPRYQEYFLCDEIGFISFFRDQLLLPHHQSRYNSYRLFGNFINPTTFLSSSLPFLIKYSIPQIIANFLLSQGCNPVTWDGRAGGSSYWALTFLMRMSYLPSGANFIKKELYMGYFLSQLMQCEEYEAFKAMLIYANLYDGRLDDEEKEEHLHQYTVVNQKKEKKKGLIDVYPKQFERLLDVIISTLNCSNVIIIENNNNRNTSNNSPLGGYSFGIVSILNITYTIRQLAKDQGNHDHLCRSMILFDCMARIIDLFNNDAPQLSLRITYTTYAGGGGNDHFSLEYVIEGVLLLSYYLLDPVRMDETVLYERVISKHFMTTSRDKASSITIYNTLKALQDLPISRNVSNKVKIMTSLILQSCDEFSGSIVRQNTVF